MRKKITGALILFFIICSAAGSGVFAQEDQLSRAVDALNKPPVTVKNRKEIKTWMEENKGLGTPKSKKIKENGKKFLIIWNCPFSGRAATYAYSYMKEGGSWKLVLNRLIEGTNDLSVDYDKESNSIVYKSSSGEIVLKQQI
jgi:hypothetical protein